jgi:hypothetical protein
MKVHVLVFLLKCSRYKISEKEISLELTTRLSVLVFLMSHRVSRFWAWCIEMFLIFSYSEHSNKIPSRTPITKLPFSLLHDFGEYFVEFKKVVLGIVIMLYLTLIQSFFKYFSILIWKYRTKYLYNPFNLILLILFFPDSNF